MLKIDSKVRDIVVNFIQTIRFSEIGAEISAKGIVQVLKDLEEIKPEVTPEIIKTDDDNKKSEVSA